MIEFNGFDEGNVGPILKKEEVGFMGSVAPAACYRSRKKLLLFLLVVKSQARPWIWTGGMEKPAEKKLGIL